MTVISIVSVPQVTADDQSLKGIALFSCFGLVVSLCLMAAGVDLNPQLNMHRPSRGGNSGRFVEELLNTGCTPLMRVVIANDIEVAQALLEKGASPNIVGMGLTPFLIAAGVGRCVRVALRRPAPDGAAVVAAGLLAMAAFNLFIDGFYQRHFWVLMACALAMPAPPRLLGTDGAAVATRRILEELT